MTTLERGEGLQHLAAYGADLRRMLTPEVAEKAGSCLLYAMAIGVGGMQLKQPAQAAGIPSGEEEGTATRFFDDRGCQVDRAAFANATLFHSRVQDDSHPAGHVGAVVVPAAIAMAEATGARGNTLLSAIAAGYEVALRIGRDHAVDLSERGFRTTSAYGVFGAAAAASRVLCLDASLMAQALSLAANFGGGLREFSEAGSEDFPFQAGLAASNGILAAELAEAGVTGAATALDGAAGFFRAYGKDGVDYGRRLVDGLGSVFEIEGVTYKPYPICQFHRGIVRGCSILREGAEASPLRSLTVRMHPFEACFYGVQFAGPFETFPQTFMSAIYCAALAWTRGGVTLAGMHEFEAPDILAVVPLVRIVADKSVARYAPQLSATLQDGSVLEWSEQDTENAYVLTWDAAQRMTRSIFDEMGVDSAIGDRLILAVAKVYSAPDVGDLVAAMREACGEVRHANE